MSQKLPIFLAVLITALAVSGLMFVFTNSKNTPEAPIAATHPPEWKNIIKHHCEQSGGTFNNDEKCVCPTEFEDNDMYDKNSGQCQTTFGGPGGAIGDAMNQCIGLRFALDECQKK